MSGSKTLLKDLPPPYSSDHSLPAPQSQAVPRIEHAENEHSDNLLNVAGSSKKSARNSNVSLNASARNSNVSLNADSKKKSGSKVGDFFRSALGLNQEPEDPIPSAEEIEKLKRQRDKEIVAQSKVTGGGGGVTTALGVVAAANTANVVLGFL